MPLKQPYSSRIPTHLATALLLATLTGLAIPRKGFAETQETSTTLEVEKAALVKLQGFVGQWKGMGLPKAGGAKGGWGVTGNWSWSFKDGHAALIFKAGDSKYFDSARLERGSEKDSIKFTAKGKNYAKPLNYSGRINENGELVLLNTEPATGQPAKVTYSLIAKGKRMVVFLESKTGNRFRPLAEIGLTRKGSGFGKNTKERECVITGGLGTMAVTHKGKTYYVCCGGCKDVFIENPEAELAAYHKRKAEEKTSLKK